MKRFVFRLGRLERLLKIRRDQARAALAATLAESARLTRQRESSENDYRDALSRELPRDRVSDPLALREMAEWRAGMRRLVAHAGRMQEEAAERVRVAADEHAGKAREHRVLEKLRERRRKRWLEESESEERKFLDETHLLRRVADAETRTDEEV